MLHADGDLDDEHVVRPYADVVEKHGEWGRELRERRRDECSDGIGLEGLHADDVWWLCGDADTRAQEHT